MKKTPLMVILVSVVLASCTMPTMPWTKTASTTDAEVVTDETSTDTATDEKMSGETTLPKDNAKTDTPTTSTDITPGDTPKWIAPGGVYLPYTSTAVAQAKGSVVLFFHANWCSTCVAIEKDIKAHLKDIPKDVTILRVNYDDATDLKELYSVTGQYTFVQVDNSGKLIKKWRGGSTLKEVLAQLNGNTPQDIPETTAPKTTAPTASWKNATDPF